VVCGCMAFMAAACTDIVAATGDAVADSPRRRSKSKAANFTYEGPVAVIRLEIDGSDARCGDGCSGKGRRCFAYGGRCSVTPRPVPGVLGCPPRARGRSKGITVPVRAVPQGH
jgi:hypothetical protein